MTFDYDTDLRPARSAAAKAWADRQTVTVEWTRGSHGTGRTRSKEATFARGWRRADGARCIETVTGAIVEDTALGFDELWEDGGHNCGG